MSRLGRLLVRAGDPRLVGLVLTVGLLLCGEAWGRIGGGQHFGGGGGRSGGGGGGGGGDGIPIDLLILLCIEYPAVGIPLLILVGVIAVVRWSMTPTGQRRIVGHSPPVPHTRHRRRPSGGLERLRQADSAFSMPVLQDYLILVHRRAHEAMATDGWSPLEPFVSPEARHQLEAAHPHVQAIHEVVVGSVNVAGVRAQRASFELEARFASTRLEVLTGGEQRRTYVEETWRFRRAADATSLPPDESLRLGCPSCGAAVECDRLGGCTHCGQPITRGQLQWQACGVRVHVHRSAAPPEVGRMAGGDEPSVHAPTVLQPELTAAFRRLQGRHPDFRIGDFQQRLRTTYHTLQEAWSNADLAAIRPFVTDPMFQTLRFWIERYQRAGLRNQLTDVRLEKVVVVRVDVDAWYEAITVRLWGSMKDATVDANRRVVGGHATVDRRFSEYWTFLRTAGSGGSVHADPTCPSCGAPLDNVNASGICGYCDTKITTGRFDWVLSRIDQVEAYRG